MAVVITTAAIPIFISLICGIIAFSCFFSMLRIVLVMTPLTQCSKIIIRTIFGSMIKVRNRQNDISVLSCLGVVAVCVIFHSAELATVVRSFEYSRSYFLPILWIASFIFGLNWHC